MGEFNKMYQSSRWKRRRRLLLKNSPFCVECLKNGRLTFASIIDHIKPHRGDWALFLAADNLQTLCAACHGKKSRLEKLDGGKM